jgi:DNA-directed RNA polymerase specialized sigma24 family protein
MSRPPHPFADLHAVARRYARRAEEADDLLQSALLAALESGRADLAAPDTRRWIAGCMRNRAAFDARTAVRRKRRDAAWADDGPAATPETPPPDDAEAALQSLSPALRLTARLALTGHTRQEISWLLGLTDVALRQRISQIRRALDAAPLRAGAAEPALAGALAFGRIRDALYRQFRRPEAFLASHDPDGHLFVVGRIKRL